uniref:Uncharacterized protein n=1 Tax=Salix viminalis TaxID=40686 RepID=A0A6N2K2R2_SALVM
MARRSWQLVHLNSSGLLIGIISYDMAADLLDKVAICRALISGAILQSTVNASTKALIKILKAAEGCNSLENRLRLIVDARSFIEEEEVPKTSSEKLESLGWSFRRLEETLIDSVENYPETGLLDQTNLDRQVNLSQIPDIGFSVTMFGQIKVTCLDWVNDPY